MWNSPLNCIKKWISPMNCIKKVNFAPELHKKANFVYEFHKNCEFRPCLYNITCNFNKHKICRKFDPIFMFREIFWSYTSLLATTQYLTQNLAEYRVLLDIQWYFYVICFFKVDLKIKIFKVLLDYAVNWKLKCQSAMTIICN